MAQFSMSMNFSWKSALHTRTQLAQVHNVTLAVVDDDEVKLLCKYRHFYSIEYEMTI